MNNIPVTLTTASRRFYEGMRASEAIKNKTYKNFITRDFVNIDKNKNGILEKDEIIKERKYEVKLSLFTAIASFLVSGMTCSLKKKIIPDYVCMFGLFGLGALYSFAAYFIHDENKKLFADNSQQKN